MTRRGAVVAAALAVAGGIFFNMPAQAQHECAALQEAYIENPDARPTLLVALQAFGCTVPNVNTTSTVATTTSSTTSTTTTIPGPPPDPACATLQQNYILNPAARPTLLPLLAQFGCTVPVIPTTTSTIATTTTTITIPPITIPPITIPPITIPPITIPPITIPPSVDPACVSLVQAYNTAPAELRPAILAALLAFGCEVPLNGPVTA